MYWIACDMLCSPHFQTGLQNTVPIVGRTPWNGSWRWRVKRLPLLSYLYSTTRFPALSTIPATQNWYTEFRKSIVVFCSAVCAPDFGGDFLVSNYSCRSSMRVCSLGDFRFRRLIAFLLIWYTRAKIKQQMETNKKTTSAIPTNPVIISTAEGLLLLLASIPAQNVSIVHLKTYFINSDIFSIPSLCSGAS